MNKEEKIQLAKLVNSLLRVLLATTASASLYPAVIMPAFYDGVTSVSEACDLFTLYSVLSIWDP